MYRWLTLLLATLVVLITAFAFDHGFWSSRYAYGFAGFTPDGGRPAHLAVLVEHLRSRVFATGSGPIRTRTWDAAPRPVPALRRAISSWDGSYQLPERTLRFKDRFALTPDFLTDEEILRLPVEVAGGRRIAFFGTSQTRGQGAETVADTFVARVHARLAAALGDLPLETYNLAVPGSQSGPLLALYRRSWRNIRPDLLVVNLSNNDSDPEVLVENLRALTAEVRRDGGRIVFVLEANTTERDLEWHLHLHEAVAGLGKELNVPVWDLHGYLASDGVFDSGRLWWDNVHMTSYGQSLVADWLAPRVLPLLVEP
jgi:lysophospholipase L1-like esterase